MTMLPPWVDAAAPLEPLVTFLKNWHGLEVEVPRGADPLSWWSDLLEREASLLTETQNVFVAPPETAEDDPFLVWSGDHVVERPLPELSVFYVENQGVITWAAESGSPDPTVWARCGNHSGAEGWRKEDDPFSRVLLKAVLLESMWGASEGGCIDLMATDAWERIRARDLQRIAFAKAPNLWPDFYRGDGYLAAVFGEEGPDTRLMLASPTAGTLDFLHDDVDNPWDFGL